MSVLVDPIEYGYQNSASNVGDDSLGKQQFLQLLMVQLQHQDPLNPMDDKEFVAQMAQFTSLEQLTNINEGIDTLNSSFERQDMMSAVSFLGQDIKADGYTISKEDDTVSKVFYGFDESVTNIYVNIFDEWGNLVHTDELGASKPGEYEYVWDGKNWDGQVQDNGVYQVAIGAETLDGQPVMVETAVSGTVSGVITQNGSNYLRLSDGRILNFLNISEVVSPGSLEAAGEVEEPEDEN